MSLARHTLEVDYDDWQLQSCLFDYLNVVRGPYTVDRFVDDRNAQLTIFNSKEFSIKYFISLVSTYSLLLGQVKIIAFVHQFHSSCEYWRKFEQATLIVSWLESSYFLHILRPTGKSWHSLVKDVRRFPVAYIRGRHTSLHSAFSDSPPFWTLALRLVVS